MDTIARPLADTNPAVISLKAKIDATTTQLGCGPTTLVTTLTGDKRTAELGFDGVDDLITWAAWLHWPWASAARNGRHAVVAYGQWAGFGCTLTGDEPLDAAVQ